MLGIGFYRSHLNGKIKLIPFLCWLAGSISCLIVSIVGLIFVSKNNYIANPN